MKRVYIHILCLLVLLFSLSACVSTVQNLSGNDTAVQETLTNDKSLVFGNILWIEKGKQKSIGSGLFDFYIKPDLLRIEDKARTICDVGENGDFVWALEPGTYVINKMQYRDTWSGNYFFIPKSAFRIAEPGKAYYIGQLEVHFEPKRDLIGGLSGKATFMVNDQSPEVYGKFLQENNRPLEDIQKSLMVHDPRLPTSFDTTAEFNVGVQLLNAILSAM